LENHLELSNFSYISHYFVTEEKKKQKGKRITHKKNEEMERGRRHYEVRKKKIKFSYT